MIDLTLICEFPQLWTLAPVLNGEKLYDWLQVYVHAEVLKYHARCGPIAGGVNSDHDGDDALFFEFVKRTTSKAIDTIRWVKYRRQELIDQGDMKCENRLLWLVENDKDFERTIHRIENYIEAVGHAVFSMTKTSAI